MAQPEYRDTFEFPANLLRTVFTDLSRQGWRVTALVVHRHPESGKELKRMACLRRVDASGGRDGEIPLATLHETAEVDR
ncbi:hypothetical protein ACGFNX_28220 [Streptomyces sp. NPDC048723]|uniref:hypothetical protein n=1 Tax=unclassified Streptomyces TaxID=2593676 RepID=UPI003566CA4A